MYRWTRCAPCRPHHRGLLTAPQKRNRDEPEARKNSAKSAVTTAIVRALKRFGPALGLGLNDPAALARCTPMQPLPARPSVRPAGTGARATSAGKRTARPGPYARLANLADLLPFSLDTSPKTAPGPPPRAPSTPSKRPAAGAPHTSRWRAPSTHASTATPRTLPVATAHAPTQTARGAGPGPESAAWSDDDDAFAIDVAALEAEAGGAAAE